MKIKEFSPGSTIAILISLLAWYPWKLIPYYWWARPWTYLSDSSASESTL